MSIAHRIVGSLVLAAALGVPHVPAHAQPPAEPAWKPVPGHIMTRWAGEVTPGATLPEYPRPTMVRDRWLNLNGLWSYTVLGADGKEAAAGPNADHVEHPL